MLGRYSIKLYKCFVLAGVCILRPLYQINIVLTCKEPYSILIGKIYRTLKFTQLEDPFEEPFIIKGFIIKLSKEMKWNESGFRPPLCTYRLSWARRTSWGWWDDWDDTVLQTQDSKFEPWRSELSKEPSNIRRRWTFERTKVNCFQVKNHLENLKTIRE